MPADDAPMSVIRCFTWRWRPPPTLRKLAAICWRIAVEPIM